MKELAVEFFINDSLFFTDTESPYEYDWNTTQYEDNSEHIVRSFLMITLITLQLRNLFYT